MDFVGTLSIILTWCFHNWDQVMELFGALGLGWLLPQPDFVLRFILCMKTLGKETNT